MRLFAAIAIVEDGSARIDAFAPLTIDKASFDGHFYSDKAPGMTLMALPAVAVAGMASGTRAADVSLYPYDPAADRYMRLRLRLAAATTLALLTAVAAALLLSFGTTIGGSAAAGAFAAIGFALGTPMWGWSTTIFGHAAVAALFGIAIWAAWRGTEGPRPSRLHAAIAGGALGWAVVVEHSALLTGLPIGLFALWRMRRWPGRQALAALIAAAIPALAAGLILAGYNLFAFGDAFRLGYQGVVGWDGMREGVFGLTYPKADAAWQVTLGTRRGLIWVAPVLVAGLGGIALLIRRADTRALGVIALAGAALALAYNASYAYWDGGNSTGPRHLMPAVPYLALGLAPAWAWLSARAWRIALIALLALSVTVNLVIAAAETMTGGPGDFPLWSDVFRARFLAGDLRTFPGEWLGWGDWSGLALYVALASLLGWALVGAVRSPR